MCMCFDVFRSQLYHIKDSIHLTRLNVARNIDTATVLFFKK